ncbi:MAG: hypothetical protein ACFWUC_06675 [Oscillospiraceae bacterium]
MTFLCLYEIANFIVLYLFVASAIVSFTCSMFQRKMEQLNAAPSGVSMLVDRNN